MSGYGLLLILLPISMAAVPAMPDHHHKLTPHGRHQSHRHPQPDRLPAEHPVRHHSRQPGFKDFDDNELQVLPLEGPKYWQRNQMLWNRKRHQRHLDLKSPYVLEEDDFEKRFDAKCGYTVESVPCGGNSCAKKHLRHIKCNHTGMRHGNGLCIQTYRNVMLDCNDSSTGIVRLFTGCVFATQTMMSTLPGVNISQ